MKGWLNRFAEVMRDPHVDAAVSVQRTNIVTQLARDVGDGKRIPPERWREVREMLDRDDALMTLFGAPPSTRRNGR